jgi:hypothetical protein
MGGQWTGARGGGQGAAVSSRGERSRTSIIDHSSSSSGGSSGSSSSRPAAVAAGVGREAARGRENTHVKV